MKVQSVSRLFSIFLFILSFGLFIIPTKAEAGTHSIPVGPWYISAQNSGKCLDITGASLQNGAKLEQWTCISNHTNQEFRLVPSTYNDDELYQIVNVNSGKCLEVPGGSSSAGTQLDQTTCAGSLQPYRQVWFIYKCTDNDPAPCDFGYPYVIVSVDNDLSYVMNVYEASLTSGAAIIQYPYRNTANEHWSITLP